MQKIPVKAQAASQHSPVTTACAGGIQTGTNFLPYGSGQSESIWAHLRWRQTRTACWQGRVRRQGLKSKRTNTGKEVSARYYILFSNHSLVTWQNRSCCFLYLLDVGVKLEYLSLPLHLSDTDLAGELGNHQASSLQTEGAMQRPLTPTPNVIEWDFLWPHTHTIKRLIFSEMEHHELHDLTMLKWVTF